jgi:hypothetical protein
LRGCRGTPVAGWSSKISTAWNGQRSWCLRHSPCARYGCVNRIHTAVHASCAAHSLLDVESSACSTHSRATPSRLTTLSLHTISPQGKYVGMLDVRDLIAFIVFENSEGEALRKVPGLEGTTEFISRLLGAGARMYEAPPTTPPPPPPPPVVHTDSVARRSILVYCAPLASLIVNEASLQLLNIGVM